MKAALQAVDSINCTSDLTETTDVAVFSSIIDLRVAFCPSFTNGNLIIDSDA